MLPEGLDRREFLSACGRLGLGALAAGGLCSVGSMLCPPAAQAAVGNVSSQVARFWESNGDGSVTCNLCPRHCQPTEGERGNCLARLNRGGQLTSLVYGKPAAVHGDPIEKAPFFHYHPGWRTLAVGTAGCNQHCKFCQNWEFTQSLPETTDNQDLSPASMAEQVQSWGIPIIIFTLNDPIQCIEYFLDTAKEAHARGILIVLHTGGYCCQEPFKEILHATDAICMDLKGFTEDYYKSMTGAQLATVQESIKLAHGSGKWLELINLVIPGYNDNPDTFRQMCQWIVGDLSPDVPLFVSRFFPKYQLRRLESTSPDTLRALRKIAYEVGLRYCYLGNMPGDMAESTYCPACGCKVIKRNGSEIVNTGLNFDTGTCSQCGYRLAGVWQPG